MDFWDLTKLMFRRWYVSVPAFLVAIGATLYVASRVEPDYVATSYVQLVPPAITPKERDETKASARNPWLDSGLPALTKAGMISVQDSRVAKEMESAGLSDDYTLTQDLQLPIVTFEVIGDDEAQATQSTERLVKRFTDSVTTLQKDYGAPKEQMVTARRLDLGSNVEESTSKVKRALIAVAGVGVLLALALTVATDALLRRRRRKDPEPAAPPAPAPKPDAGAAEIPAQRAADESRTQPIVTPPPIHPVKIVPPRPAGQYGTKRSHPPVPGEETAVILRPPGEDTVVLPQGWQTRNGHNGSGHNGSKRP